jgi:predicted AlkP superfamily pyrophosphatase or phosphodiesterase
MKAANGCGELAVRIFGMVAAAVLTLAGVDAAGAAPVVMISIDGLRPGDVLDADARGVKAPNLRRLAEQGVYATGVRDALPSVTYPNHTTLVTGVWPARHGIASNTTFDPMRRNLEGWYWYNAAIRVPTLWSAVHAAGRTTASLGWPVTVDAPAIDFDLPEYWRAKTAQDIPLAHALATPGLPEAIEARVHVGLADIADVSPAADAAKAKAAIALVELKHPAFFTLHLSSLDHVEHLFGPGSPEAYDALARIDAEVGDIVAAARREAPGVVVVIVSDHGFAPVEHDLNLGAAFVQAGLIRLDAAGQPASWDAAIWASGGSAAVVLARPDDPALRARVAALLERLAADPASGVGRVIDRAGIAAMGGAPDADFFVDARIGYEIAAGLSGPLVAPGAQKGTHGYFPDHPEMRAALIIQGSGVRPAGSLGEVDMRDIAPTVARLLDVPLPSADGRPLF